jgi:hypothetical protein
MRPGDPGVGLLQFNDEAVDLCQELGTTGCGLWVINSDE